MRRNPLVSGLGIVALSLLSIAGCDSDQHGSGGAGSTSSSTSSTSSSSSSSSGAMVECTVAMDCPDPGNECLVRACVDGKCEPAPVAAGTVIAAQTPGDCKVVACDGTGQTMTSNDDADVPVDGVECTDDVCSNGMGSNPNREVDTPCGMDLLLRCDGNGACVTCTKDADCGVVTDCMTPVCVSGTCEATYANDGTMTSNQTAGDCQEEQCNGLGGTKLVPAADCGAGFVCLGAPSVCTDVDECATGNGGCDVLATCTNTPGSRTCTCNAGYVGDGLTCTLPSCNGLASNCGPNQNENCCASSVVTGGTYNRSNNPSYPATVSDFRLDRFEITVGRFRKFVEAYPGSKPAVNSGAHPLIAGSGWNSAWDIYLPADQTELKAAMKSNMMNHTWTETPGANEQLPQNGLDWYLAFAFCAWDGGRLPTEAEWNYAAAGGNEQRQYPWSNPPSSTTIDGTYAAYDGLGDGSAAGSYSFADILKVGSKSPKGDGKWGQADLSGNIYEWILDGYQSPYATPCSNCANVTNMTSRSVRGGSWSGTASDQLSSFRLSGVTTFRGSTIGARCARTP